ASGDIPWRNTTLTTSSGAYSPDRIIVKRKPSVSEDQLAASSPQGTQIISSYTNRLAVVSLPSTITVAEALNYYRQGGLVEYAEPDFICRAFQVTPNDTLFTNLWGLHNTGQNGGTPGVDIKGPEAWAIRTSAPNIIVAITDTGARLTHED